MKPESLFPKTDLLISMRNKKGFQINDRGRRGRDSMVVGSTTTYAISAYHHQSCEFEPRTWQGILDTTLCDKDCRWFPLLSSGTRVSSGFLCFPLVLWFPPPLILTTTT